MTMEPDQDAITPLEQPQRRSADRGEPATEPSTVRPQKRVVPPDTSTAPVEAIDIRPSAYQEFLDTASSKINTEFLEALAADPEAVLRMIAAAKQRGEAQAAAVGVRPRYDDDGRIASEVRGSSAATNMRESPQFRALLQRLETFEGGPGTLEAIRDVYAQLKEVINGLGTNDGLPDTPDLNFMKTMATKDIDAVLHSLSATGYDRTATERLAGAAGVMATLTSGALPFAYAHYTESPWYYFGALGRAYSQTIPILAGLAGDGAVTLGMIGEATATRHLPYTVTPLLLSAAPFAKAVAEAYPENQAAQYAVNVLQPVLSHPAYSAGVAFIAGLVYASANRPKLAAAWARAPKELYDRTLGGGPSQKTRFRSGDMQFQEPTRPVRNLAERTLLDEIDTIRRLYHLGAGLLGTVDVVADKWQGKGEAGRFQTLGAAQRGHHAETRKKTDHLGNTLDLIVGHVKDAVELIDPSEAAEKRKVTNRLHIAGLVLAGISTAGSYNHTSSLAYFLENLAYYSTAMADVELEARHPATRTDDVSRRWASFFGGTSINVPFSALNAFTENMYPKKEGIWDMVTRDPTAKFVPDRPLTNHAWLHGFGTDGKINFAVYSSSVILLTLYAGSAGGQKIAKGVVRSMARKVEDVERGDNVLDSDGGPVNPEELRQVIAIFNHLRGPSLQQDPPAPEHGRITEVSDSPPLDANRGLPPPDSETEMHELHPEVRHWQTLPEGMRNGDPWNADQIKDFAAYTKQDTFARVTPEGLHDLTVRGLALTRTQMLLFSSSQRRLPRILDLPEGHQVNGKPLTPGDFVEGDIRSRDREREVEPKQPIHAHAHG
jgi:hypothetical protein